MGEWVEVVQYCVVILCLSLIWFFFFFDFVLLFCLLFCYFCKGSLLRPRILLFQASSATSCIFYISWYLYNILENKWNEINEYSDIGKLLKIYVETRENGIISLLNLILIWRQCMVLETDTIKLNKAKKVWQRNFNGYQKDKTPQAGLRNICIQLYGYRFGSKHIHVTSLAYVEYLKQCVTLLLS